MNSKAKQKLYKKLNYEQPYENSLKIPLISTYSELIDILTTIENKAKFFYLDNKEINEILYQENKIIKIENKKYDYSFLFYLSLLLKENKDFVNFIFGIDFIKEIDDENKNQENELKKLFVSRIILDLIYSYEEEKNEELKTIEEKNKIYITDNINLFKKYNLNLENIEEISLGKLYLDIIIELIKSKKLENYDFSNDILTKLDLENIDINQNMFGELKNILDDERYINDYKMNDIEDFFVEAKINFYYILIKYIFKNSFFIYNIPLLYNARNTIIKIITKRKNEFLSYFNIENTDLFKRINYNIKFILDSNYYLNIFTDIIFENIFEEALKNNRKNWKEYTKDLNISENFIDKMSLIIYLYESTKEDMEKNQIEFKEILSNYKHLEKIIKDKKTKEITKDNKLILSKYFIDNNNKDSLLRIFGQDSYDFFLKEIIKLNEIEKKEKQNKLKEILKYYKTFFFESKKEDISSIENAINDQGDLNYKIYEPDFEKAIMINDRIQLINYLYKIKDGNKNESEMQQIIEKYNSLEKSISERKLMKDIENEIFSQLFFYFNDKKNEEFLIKIFGKKNYEFTLKYLNENYNNKKMKINILDENNVKENYSEVNNQNNVEKYNSKLLSLLANHILKKSEVILNTKKKGDKLYFIFDSVSFGDYHIYINYEKLLQIKEFFIKNKIESKISKSFFKYMEFLDEFKNRIKKEFTNEYKLKIGLEFKINRKDDIYTIFNINCCYKFYSPNLDIASNQIFEEENILLNKTNSKTQSFEYLINEINQEYFKGIKFQDSSPKETNKILNNKKNNNSPYCYKDIFNNDIFFSEIIFPTKFEILEEETHFDLKIEAKEYQILKIIGIVGEHKDSAEFIIELSNGYYISGGSDNILKIYDKDFIQIKELKNIEEMLYSCYEKKKSLNNDYNIELIACCFKKLIQIFLSFKDEIKCRNQKYDFSNVEMKSCVQIKGNNFAIIGQNKSAYYIDLFNSQRNIIKACSIVSGKSYFGSIKINQNTIAITSNKVQDFGEDKLIFYNIDEKKIIREIEGYSFILGINGLALMPREGTKDKNKILLCACTKYIDDQKNGIYLANPQLEDNKIVNHPFYDTGNFEVFCFCPILIFKPYNEIEEKGKEKIIIDTDYFFVGGFNEDKKEGEIKLFKVIYSEKACDNKIEFVQNIEFERNKDFNGFEGAISCIIQTQKENYGNILVTCYSGKVYLLNKPNLDYYLNTKNTL